MLEQTQHAHRRCLKPEGRFRGYYLVHRAALYHSSRKVRHLEYPVFDWDVVYHV